MDLDLEKLFQPSWAQEKPAGNRFEKFTGNEGVKPERSFSSKPGERRAPRRDAGGGGGGAGGPGRGGSPRGGSKFGGGDRKAGGFRGADRGDFRRERPAPPAPLPELAVTFVPVENGVESLARQIKMTGRAYPLFQIAQLVLDKPERYSVQLAVKKPAAGAAPQQLFVCALDDSPWLSEDEAVAHVLKNHFATFYQAERTPTEPPKGVYTFVAQCSLSGAILGPPNHHDYQNQLRKLHAERFARMPFDAFKANVKIVKDEVVVKKWIEDQSFKTEFVCLNVPEPLRLPSMEAVEQHFRTTHKDTIIKAVETLTIAGVPSRNLRNRELQRLVRGEWEHQKYFPLQLATGLSRQFANLGLHFFKVNKTVTHVAVARPQFLDLDTTPVSGNIRRIVQFINEHPKCTRRKMIEALAPSPAKPAVIELKPEGAAASAAAATDEPTAEQTALVADLHWLVHQGHVLEFADGKLDTAKKPMPRPPKPAGKAAKAAVEPKVETAANGEAQPVVEVAGEVPAAQAHAEAQAEALAEIETATEAELSAPVSTPAGEPAPAVEQPNQI